MLGVILDADSLGKDINLRPITNLLDYWQVYPDTNENQVADRIREATVVLSNKISLNADNLSKANALKFVSVMATGINNIDLDFVKNHKIQVSNATGYATPSVVQHTLALMLALSTNLPAYLKDVQDGQWQQSNVFCRLDHPIQEIAGKTLGIVGNGELGSNVASAAEALGMTIMLSERIGSSPRPNRVTFSTVLKEADYISLHCPLNDDTLDMIDADALDTMKSSAFLINTARGGLVNSTALIDALQTGKIAGAAIDVLAQEPATNDEPLIMADLPNLLITPHNAWGAIESRNRLIEQTAQNIQGFLLGTPPRLVTNS